MTNETRPLSVIAEEIRTTWVRKDGSSAVYFGAAPYLEAMRALDKITDSYFFDSGDDIVRYFLANANTYRGETARRVKAELKVMLIMTPR